MEQPVKDKAPKPQGLIPKNLQSFVLIGIALLMVLIMAVTGHKRPVTPNAVTPEPFPSPLPVNSEKVVDFQKSIEQTQRAEAALLQQQKQLAAQRLGSAQPSPTTPFGAPVTSAYPNGAYPPGAYAAVPPQPSGGQPAPDSIKDEKSKREYLSLFSDNVALTFRKELVALNSVRNAAISATMEPNTQVAGLTKTYDPFSGQDQLLEQAREQLSQEGRLLQLAQERGLVPPGPLPRPLTSAEPSQPVGSLPANQEQPEPSKQKTAGPEAPPSSFHSADGKTYVLFEGTVLEALLINRLDGSFSGPVSCLVTNNVYSHDRQHLLVPSGSKILGEAIKVDSFGQARLAVVFHRLIMPDGYSVNLEQFKGLDQEGATALQDKVNNHYAKIFGASLAIGILGSAAQLGTGSVLNSGGADRIREGFGVGLATAAEQIVDLFLNILPTVTVREGTRIKIYLSSDLLLPEYIAHRTAPNL